MGLRGLKADGGMWHRLNPGSKIFQPSELSVLPESITPSPPQKKKNMEKKSNATHLSKSDIWIQSLDRFNFLNNAFFGLNW